VGAETRAPGPDTRSASFLTEAVSDLERSRIYKLMTGLVVPRPIALVSTLSSDGVGNLAPFSFFTILSMSPPMIGVSIGERGGSARKDTLANIAATGEFVVNVVNRAIAEPMNKASLDWEAEVDEFTVSGLTPIFDNLAVKPARVAESPAQLECRLVKAIPMGDYTFVVGEVLAFHRREDLCANRSYVDQQRLEAVGRMAGSNYCTTAELFSIQRNADSPELTPNGGRPAR
jgi:flavin reductase (DIM6/NTAB) family NADH-FMN oxidoreductase RutF